jgi:anti-anti-sigma regulatory factor
MSVEIEMTREKPSFTIEERASAQNHRLVLGGAMQPADASELQGVVARICRGPRTRVTLDLRGLTAIGSAGMHCLMAAYEIAREHGHELIVAPEQRIAEAHELIEILAGLPLLPAETAAASDSM